MFRRWRRRSGSQRAGLPSADLGPRVSMQALPSETAARQAAASGSPVEMNRLGIVLNMKGREDEAAEWFRKAANAGSEDAMANLATYLMGKGRNEEAAEWFRRAGGPLGEALAERLSGPARGQARDRRKAR
jgi:TPR repeat protein